MGRSTSKPRLRHNLRTTCHSATLAQILTPRFQYVWFLSLIVVVWSEIAGPYYAAGNLEFMLMTIIYWVVFTCPRRWR